MTAQNESNVCSNETTRTITRVPERSVSALLSLGLVIILTALIEPICASAQNDSKHWLKGHEKERAGDLDGAVAEYSKAISADPKGVRNYRSRALARNKKGDYDGCIADCNKALQLDPENIVLYDIRRIAKKAKGDLAGAAADSQKELALAQKWRETHPSLDGQTPAISITTGADGKSRTFLAGELAVGADVLAIDNGSFVCTTVQPLKKGDKIAGRTSEDQAWSTAAHSWEMGGRSVRCPIMGMVKCAPGAFKDVFAATTTVRIDLREGQCIHSDGFQIEAKRAVKAGETIPTLLVGGDSALGIEAVQQANDPDNRPLPCLIILKEGVTADKRALAVEAWQIVKHDYNN